MYESNSAFVLTYHGWIKVCFCYQVYAVYKQGHSSAVAMPTASTSNKQAQSTDIYSGDTGC